MKIRGVVLGVVLAACGTHGQMRVDSPVTAYQPPDISDLTGIDEDDAGSAAATPPATPPGAPGAAPAAKPAGK